MSNNFRGVLSPTSKRLTTKMTTINALNTILPQTWTQDVSIGIFYVSADFIGTGISYSLAPLSDPLPPGVSLSVRGIISGTPTSITSTRNIIVRGTNVTGFDDTSFSVGFNVGGISNTTLPAILGLLSQNSILEFDVGYWTGPPTITFDMQVRQINPTATPIARQAISGVTAGSLATVVGASYYLDVWAKDGLGNEVLATSPVFGPVTVAAMTHILGIVVNASNVFNPDPAGYPYDMTLFPVNPATLQYAASPGWGYAGSLASTTGHGTSNKGSGTPLLKGFHNFTGNMGQTSIRIDVTPGVYQLHVALGGASAQTPRMRVRDGSATGTVLHEINYVSLTSVGSTQVLDATGALLTGDQWLATSPAGGTGVQFTVTGNAIFIGPDQTGVCDRLQCLNLFKVS